MLQASLLSPSPESGDVTRESLAEHIVAAIERTCGPQLPCYQSSEILGGFFDRFGPEDGMAICDRAFSHHGGTWRSAPVTVMRFQPSNDPYFAIPLLEESRAGSR
jgi:hypothetical protein